MTENHYMNINALRDAVERYDARLQLHNVSDTCFLTERFLLDSGCIAVTCLNQNLEDISGEYRIIITDEILEMDCLVFPHWICSKIEEYLSEYMGVRL